MPLPPGFTTRPLTLDDLPSILANVNASETHVGLPIVTTAADLEADFTDSYSNIAEDTQAVLDADGRLVAHIRVSKRPNPNKEHVAQVEGRVRPDSERLGLATWLIDWAVNRATELLTTSDSDLPHAIRAHLYEQDEAAVAAYTAAGFQAERHYNELERLVTPIPALAPLSDEIHIEPWTQERDDEIRQVHNAAFVDHWGSEPLTAERWQRWLSLHEAFVPSASFIAVVDGAVVGYLISQAYPEEWDLLGYSSGWINALGTSPEWRGNGIASVLIAESLRAYERLGYERANLGVDVENSTGALGLYTSLGFELVRREVAFGLRPNGTD